MLAKLDFQGTLKSLIRKRPSVVTKKNRIIFQAVSSALHAARQWCLIGIGQKVYLMRQWLLLDQCIIKECLTGKSQYWWMQSWFNSRASSFAWVFCQSVSLQPFLPPENQTWIDWRGQRWWELSTAQQTTDKKHLNYIAGFILINNFCSSYIARFVDSIARDTWIQQQHIQQVLISWLLN